ncbi:hypothetical protein GWK36_05385 [Caldichromatium japonicum]|uniref:Uncharacterized protein n=2 Tax=Caldichromatium japonicum TaxID=2699430 RepID=A0A6G7VGQ0_9GAMM|nr:hypothetical protein GWK36_05385 [Caldichromatium japonicum]
MRPLVSVVLLGLSGSLCPSAEVFAQDSGAIWSQAGEQAAQWWGQSRELAGQAMHEMQSWFSAQGPELNEVWQRAMPSLNQVLRLEERQPRLPKRSWFRRDQQDNQAEINALLDEAVVILSVSPARDERQRIQALELQINRWRAEILDYRQRRLSAPAQATFKKTIADYDALIAARESEIRKATQEIDRLKRQFAQSLRAIGLRLEDDQIDLLLSTVVGDHLVDLGILFDNIKRITQQLEVLLEQNGEDLEAARRYYGIYVVLLKALERMHTQIESAIATRYLPRIDEIRAQTQALAADTQRLIEQASPERRALFESNLRAQQLTLQAAEIYRQYLLEQSNQVRQARQALTQDIAAAWNTYETVRVSGELVGLIRSSRTLLQGLMDRQAPSLRHFDNLEMQREIQKLTEQLRGNLTT